MKHAQTPQETTEVFVHNFNQGDVSQLIAAYYAPGAVLAAEPGKAVAGADLKAALARYFAGGGRMEARTRHALVQGDVALLVIDWTISGQQAGQPFSLKGTSTDVVGRQPDGSWRCLIDNPHGIS